MNSNSRTAVSAELGLGLVGPEHTIVPLMASLYYSFLARTYELVPDGDESEYMDFDAELTELLGQA
jgi:hypothetical protein